MQEEFKVNMEEEIDWSNRLRRVTRYINLDKVIKNNQKEAAVE